jgi:hypothetical protein
MYRKIASVLNMPVHVPRISSLKKEKAGNTSDAESCPNWLVDEKKAILPVPGA